jgi:predicted RNA-binding Zn-ribbon protein involved in translation (DUF1610 family)
MLRITIEIDDKQNVIVNTTEPKALKTQPEKSQTTIRKDGKKHGTVDEKTCVICGKKFKPTSNVQQYCAPDCRHKKMITPEQIERSQGKPYKDYK